jgi:hypothetical protein
MITRVTVPNQSHSKVTVSNQPQVITVAANAAQRLSSLSDVVGTPQNGSLLQYDADSDSWVVSNIIERPGLIINCGNY